MFGHVDFVVKAAPGVGIVSSAVLQSDDLDEIDWEWLGADNTQVQSNYFGKGMTTTWNRGAFHPDPSNQDAFHTYTIDWTSDQIVWQIDGTTVRALTQASAASGQYPQTPMQIKVGAWSGGDSANAPGTIRQSFNSLPLKLNPANHLCNSEWAGGLTNYASGPYTMQLKSIAVTDYSTGTQYSYSGTSGNWQSIEAAGGSVNPSGGNAAKVVESSAPAVTSSSNSAPAPFEGTHRDTTSTFVTPSVYPWVSDPTTLATSASETATTYPGLPSGWTVSSSGKVIPPSAAPVSEHAFNLLFVLWTPSTNLLLTFQLQSTYPLASSTSLPVASLQVSSAGSGAGGLETVTEYDQQGFPTTVTEAAGESTAVKSYDQQGFLITSAAVAPTTTSTVLGADLKAADSSPTSSTKLKQSLATGAANSRRLAKGLRAAACGILGGALVL